MDIRNIKTPVPNILDGSGLKQMFDLQKALISHYIKIEKMPKYPIDLHTKADQSLIKDFTGRVIEELGESFESYTKMVELKTGPTKEIIPHLQNFNEELSDAFHFFLETLIYANFDETDIEGYYESILGKLNLADVFWYGGQDILKTCMAFAKHHNAHTGRYIKDFRLEWKVISDADLKDEFLRGGRAIGIPTHQELKILMWEITYWLTISRNYLKNKPWKQSQLSTDVKRFNQSIMEAWLCMFNLFDFVGHTPESVFEIYFKKNQVNLFRINSGY